MVKYHTLQRSQCATVAQPVEQLTRNEQVVRSNRISSSKVKSPKSGFAPGFSGIFVWLGKYLRKGMWALITPISRKVLKKRWLKMQVGQNAYEADVLTAIKTDQREIFYDIVDIKPIKIETSGKAHIESEDSRSRLPEASEQSIAQASGESNANEAAVLKTALKRLIEQVSSALPNRHMRLKNFVQFS
mgnify:FL=1|jgi:hypothetical protein